ncbi:MAG: glycosyltransferase [Cyclobacteriaceae bacterium]|nr:glycosyltransferase [Cyclobacteriaceae bacterium]
MKKVLFIVPYPIGLAPSQRFRFEQYFEILKENHFQFDMEPFWSEKGWSLLYQQNQMAGKVMALLRGYFKRFVLLFRIRGYEMVFIHREALPLGPPIIEYVISYIFKKRIIYDFDDAIWLPNTSEQNSLAGLLKYHRKVKHICKWSWKVSCGNDFLADYARKFNDRVYINPTTIDTLYHKPKTKTSSNQQIVIGWTGTHSTTKYLMPLVSILKELGNKYSIKIMIISNQKPDWDVDDYNFIVWNKEKEIEQLDKIDIGIMPLDDSVWEKGKCGFKALQYMALGIPAVVSKVGINNNIIDHGINGFLCRNTEDWLRYLSDLISSESLRKSIGEQGRKKVIEFYSVQSNADLFLSLFE